MNQSFEKITQSLESFIQFVTKHRFVFVFFIASSAVIAALLQSNSFLNPPRNESLYQEEKALINYSKINQEVVEKLRATQEDEDFEINPIFVPDRTNPFIE